MMSIMNLKNKTLFLDLDGTLYKGSERIESAYQFVCYLQREKIPFYFLTNNAMRTHKQNANKLRNMGYTNIEEKQFFTSAMAAASYFAKHSKKRKAYCLGEEGLREALIENGFELCNQNAEIVFVGLDSYADYHLYSKVYQMICRGAEFVGTNPDRRIPDGDTYQIGNGAIIKMLEYASEKKCFVIGKPNKPMFDEMLAYAKIKKEDCLIVGDNLETDIAFGKSNDVDTVFVTTGVHNREKQEELKIYATYCVDSLMELAKT